MHVISTILDSLNNNELSNGLYLVIHNPAQVPPHIFLVYNKKYYSLTYNKIFIANDFLKRLNLFDSKNTPLLIIELDCSFFYEIENIIANEFKKCSFAGQNDTTCLTPIKEVFFKVFKISFNNIQFIYEMIPLLKSNQLIKSIKHKNLNDEINNGTFILNDYNLNDIKNKIRNYQLKNKNVSTYTN